MVVIHLDLELVQAEEEQGAPEDQDQDHDRDHVLSPCLWLAQEQQKKKHLALDKWQEERRPST